MQNRTKRKLQAGQATVGAWAGIGHSDVWSPAGIFAMGLKHAQECLERGFQFVALGTAVGFMIQGATNALDQAGWKS